MKHGNRTGPGRTGTRGALRHRGPAGRGRRVAPVSAVTIAGSLLSVVLFVAPAGATTPTSTTTQVSATSITLGPSGTVRDAATVQGNATHGSPTGNVTFHACKIAVTQTLTTGPCAAAPANLVSTDGLSAGAGNASATNSSVFTPTSAGTWCFSASYAGDVNYGSSTDNTSSGNLDPNECLLVMTEPVTITSSSSTSSIALGSSTTVTDSVTVTGAFVAGSPTGTVVFYACQTGAGQTLTTGPCPATGTPEDPGETLVAGAGSSASATSSAFTPTSTGTWCFSATYGGDTNYSANAVNTDAGNADPDECMLVTLDTSSTHTTISAATITLGSSGHVTDSVTVTGNSTEGAPAGTVDFYVCGPTGSDALCASTSTPEGTPGLSSASADSSTAQSQVFAPAKLGTYCFAAVYVPGTAVYSGSSDNVTGTVDPDECVSVGAAPYTITSADSASATAGQFFTFPVTATPTSPAPKIKKHGRLAKGIKFVNNHNGTATISGTASPKKTGSYSITITATWGRGKTKHVATQAFTLSVDP